MIACLKLYQENKDAIVLITPADHIIENQEKYQKTILAGYEFLANNQQNSFITFGIKPDYAHTGYGYIEAEKKLADSIFAVKKFHEKPDKKTAEKYLQEKSFFWNSGIFMFKVADFIEISREKEPKNFALCEKSLKNAQKSQKNEFLTLETESFNKVKAISVDYAILEKSHNLAVLKSNFSWNDVGSWQNIHNIVKKDKENNSVFGKNITLENCKNSLVKSQGKKLTALLDVKNIAVIDTEDVLLVANLEKSQNVKNLVQKLKAEKRTEAENSATGYRPWGYYKIISQGKNYKSKQVVVYPNAQISVQYHNKRAEHWIIVQGEALVTIAEKEQILSVNQSIYIPKTVIHTIKNIGKEDLIFIEVQTGDYLEEDDIVRLKDNYGRVKK